MREYETMFIVQPEISDEGTQTILGKLDGVLEKSESERLLCEDMGKRKLAYEINKFHKGHYHVLRYLDSGQVVPEIERQLRLDESILRFMTILVSEEVVDVESRKVHAREEEVEQQKRAAERAAREAEEQSAREEAERFKAEQAAEAELAAEKAAAEAKAEAEADDTAGAEGAADEPEAVEDASDVSDASDEAAEGEKE